MPSTWCAVKRHDAASIVRHAAMPPILIVGQMFDTHRTCFQVVACWHASCNYSSIRPIQRSNDYGDNMNYDYLNIDELTTEQLDIIVGD